MFVVPNGLKEFIAQYSTFIIIGHKEPDGDCIGSCLSLDSFLKRIGKQTLLVCAGPFKRPEIKQYEQLFISSVSSSVIHSRMAVIILDCSDLSRTGDASIGLSELPFAIIDHHATNECSSPTSFIEPSASATTLLVQALIEDISGTLTQEEAELLLFGLCTDTGFFRHLDDKSASTFESTSRLVSAGGNPKKTFALMNGGKSFGSRILISRILSRMKAYYDGKLILSYETMDETNEFGLDGRDSDTLYQLIQSISGVEAIVIVRQETVDNCTVGFRSLNRIDVSKIATIFGGGGHKQAAGLSIKGTIDDLMPQFVEAFKEQFLSLNL